MQSTRAFGFGINWKFQIYIQPLNWLHTKTKGPIHFSFEIQRKVGRFVLFFHWEDNDNENKILFSIRKYGTNRTILIFESKMKDPNWKAIAFKKQ